jgi:chemotaxis protein methyltransferase CheR
MNDQEYLYLKKKILKMSNINLDAYKDQQMRRRLDMYVSHRQTRSVVEYCQTLESRPDTLADLKHYLTINVTEFFRDHDSFEYLRTTVLPQLIKGRSQLNIWSAGCSHGEEPYSLAIMLDNLAPFLQHRILATDLDEEVLCSARAGGPYSHEALKNVSPSLLQKYFTVCPKGYLVSSRIRHKVEFKQHNLISGSFETGFDLILCRNVTIYFTEGVKNELNRKFYCSLKDGGVLFIGGTEVMLDANSVGFLALKPSFYQKPGLVTSRRAGVKEALPVGM